VEIPVRIYEEITGLPDLPPPVDEADYERRKHRRVPFGHRAIISPERKGADNTPTVVMVRDVSLGGVSFLNDEALKVGTPLGIEFKGHQDRPVNLHCAVVRCEAGGSGGTQFVVGASFDAVLTKELPLQAPSEIPKLVELVPAEPKQAEPIPAETKSAKAKHAEPEVKPASRDEAISAEDEARIAEILNEPASEPANPETAAVAPAPVKSSALFRAADPTEEKKAVEAYWSEGEPVEAVPQPAAPKASPELSTPVFRDVPLPDPEPEPERKPEPQPEAQEESEPEPGSELGTEPEPEPVVEIREKEITVASEPVRPSPDHHGKTHEVLARVKELLVEQERSIEKQRQELKQQRERFEKEIKSMRSELEDTKAKLAEIRSKSDEDEDAIAELENFLKQHARREPPAKKNEAA
jgi:hypothetical protein